MSGSKSKNPNLAPMRLREYICQKCTKITNSSIAYRKKSSSSETQEPRRCDIFGVKFTSSAEERSSAFEVNINFISPENTACPKILAWSRIAAPGSLTDAAGSDLWLVISVSLQI